jgi:hypothetical protein
MTKTNIDTPNNSHLGFGDWKLEFIWSLGFGNWDLTNNPYSRVSFKIEKDVTHLK